MKWSTVDLRSTDKDKHAFVAPPGYEIFHSEEVKICNKLIISVKFFDNLFYKNVFRIKMKFQRLHQMSNVNQKYKFKLLLLFFY